MTGVIDRIRDISNRCLSTQPLESTDARWLGEALARFLSHDACTLDDAMGLHRLRGGIPWWKEQAIRSRNAALNRLARDFLADLPPRRRLERIEALGNRYAATAWLIDRERHYMPAAYRGTIREHLWTAFASGAAMPLGRRQLRNIVDLR